MNRTAKPNEKIVLQFVRKGSLVKMKVLYMKESFRDNFEVRDKNGFVMMSKCFPDLQEDLLYLRGSCKGDDERTSEHRFNTSVKAVKAIESYVKMIAKLNKSRTCYKAVKMKCWKCWETIAR